MSYSSLMPSGLLTSFALPLRTMTARGLARATKILNDAERCEDFLNKYRGDDRTRCSSPPPLPADDRESAPAPAGELADAARHLPPPPLPSPAPRAVAGKPLLAHGFTHTARLSLHQRH